MLLCYKTDFFTKSGLSRDTEGGNNNSPAGYMPIPDSAVCVMFHPCTAIDLSKIYLCLLALDTAPCVQFK